MSADNVTQSPAIKYNKAYLARLEDLFAESDYVLRYEKGNFKAGYCVLRQTRVIMVNAYYPLEGKINCLIDILREVPLDNSRFQPKSKKLWEEINSAPSAQLALPRSLEG
jgi:hypothetical protein